MLIDTSATAKYPRELKVISHAHTDWQGKTRNRLQYMLQRKVFLYLSH
jgi:hypothetical protein